MKTLIILLILFAVPVFACDTVAVTPAPAPAPAPVADVMADTGIGDMEQVDEVDCSEWINHDNPYCKEDK